MNRNLFLGVLKVESLKSGSQRGLVKALVWMTHFSRGRRGRGALLSLFYKSINLIHEISA